jgi:hypothetical protein
MQSLAAIDPPWNTLGKDKSNPIVIRPSPELGPTRLPRDPSPPAKEFDISAFQFPRPSGASLDVPSSTNTETGSTSSSTDNTPFVPARGLTKLHHRWSLKRRNREYTPGPSDGATKSANWTLIYTTSNAVHSSPRIALFRWSGCHRRDSMSCIILNGTPTRPLPSPSIALYRPPEDVLASPSSAVRLPPEGTEELDLYFPLAPMKEDLLDGERRGR